MNITLSYLAVFILSVIFGYFIRLLFGQLRAKSVEKRSHDIITSAEEQKKEIILDGKEKALKIIEESKQQEAERRKEVRELEKQLMQRQTMFEKKLMSLDDRQNQLNQQAKSNEENKERIKKVHQEAVEMLQKISGLTTEEAKQKLFESLENKLKDDIMARVKKMQDFGQEAIAQKSKELIIDAMERCAESVTQATSSASISLPSDDVKGRIIGREGRNIKVIEQLTGVEVIVDDTPETIFISSFNPLRRQLAKMVLEKLILDGRIQPARIEKIVEDAKKDLGAEIKKAGEEAVYELGIAGVDPRLIPIIGRLKFRTSYGQNILDHAKEVARLSEILAKEIGTNASLAKKAGFFHDIGKALDFEMQGTHPEIGRDLAQKYNFPKEIVEAIANHHDDHPATVEGAIVKVADTISSSRLGARNINYEDYIKRLEELENLAKTFNGVDKTYAIQAGREIRVFVRSEELDDLASQKLAINLANKIQEELKYPGEIKVTVIREKRVIEYAR